MYIYVYMYACVGCRIEGAGLRVEGEEIIDPAALSFTAGDRIFTLHPTPYTQHSNPYTLHSTPYTLHSRPYTLDPGSSFHYPAALSFTAGLSRRVSG